MRRLALVSVFAALVAANLLGVTLSLAPGLSVKNAMLYLLMGAFILEAALDANSGGLFGRQVACAALHAAFLAQMALAAISILICALVLQYPNYSLTYGILILKGELIDHYLMFIVFFVGVRSVTEAVWMAKAMLVAIAIGSLISLVDMLHIVNFEIVAPRSDGRLQGPLGSSNQYGSLMAFSIPMSIALYFLARRWERIFWIGVCGVFTSLLVLSASRGALVGLVGGGMIGATLLRRHIRASAVTRAGIIGAAVVVLVLAMLSSEYSEMLYQRFVATSLEASAYDKTSGRTHIWSDAVLTMLDVPVTLVTGFGWASFNVFNDVASHSEYVEYLYNMGLVGLALMMVTRFAVVFYVLKALERTETAAKSVQTGFLFGFLSVLAATIFGSLHDSWLFIWGLAGVMLRLGWVLQLSDAERRRRLVSLEFLDTAATKNDLGTRLQ